MNKIFTLLLFVTSFSLKAISPADSLKLVDLYNKTDGANWTNSNNWLTGPVNTWFGIDIDLDGELARINLPNNNLLSTDTIKIVGFNLLNTIDLGNDSTGILLIDSLPILQNLLLANNKVEQILFGNNQLPQLRLMEVYNSNLTGLEITNLSTIQTIIAFNSKIISINLIGITDLSYLHCGDNELQSLSITGSNNIQQLFLHRNPSINSFNFSSFTQLKQLGVNGLELNEIDLSTLVNLERLFCASNNLSSIDISNQSSLLSLSCNDNETLNTLDFSNNLLLNSLNISNTSITFLDTSNLVNLDILQCQFTPLPFSNLEAILELNLSAFIYEIGGSKIDLEASSPNIITAMNEGDSLIIPLEGDGQYTFYDIDIFEVLITDTDTIFISSMDTIVREDTFVVRYEDLSTDYITSYVYDIKNDSFSNIRFHRDVFFSAERTAIPETIPTPSGDTIETSIPIPDELVIIFDENSNRDSIVMVLEDVYGGVLEYACPCEGPELWSFPDSLFLDDEVYLGFDATRPKIVNNVDGDSEGVFENLNYQDDVLVLSDNVWQVSTDQWPTAGNLSVKGGIIGSGISQQQEAVIQYVQKGQSQLCGDINYGLGGLNINQVQSPIEDELAHETLIAYNLTESANLSNSQFEVTNLKTGDDSVKASVFATACALSIALKENAQVINLSSGYYGKKSDLLNYYIEKAIEQNTIIVTSSGNDSLDIGKLQDSFEVAYWPANFSENFDNVITVGANNSANQLSSFSNWNPNIVQILAPGENILTASATENKLIAADGTSISTALVSGALARHLSNTGDIVNLSNFLTSFYNQYSVNDSTLLNYSKDGKILDVTFDSQCGFEPTFQAFNDEKIVPLNSINFPINVVNNDSISDIQYTLSIDKSPNNGTAFTTFQNTIVYTPMNGFTGTDVIRYKLENTTNNWCTFADITINISETVAVTNLSAFNEIDLFPNPAVDHFQLNFNNNVGVDNWSFKIYNQGGKLLQADKITDQNSRIDIKSLTEGIYFIQLTDNEKHQYYSKLIVTK